MNKNSDNYTNLNTNFTNNYELILVELNKELG